MIYPFLYYGIITGSRTGSSHFCELLESTNRLGSPNEYFNPDMRIYYEDYFEKTNQSYLDKVIWSSKKENFVVGTKFNDVTHVHSAWKEGMLDKITHWIWLKRRNKVAQAVSRYIAWKSDVWDYSEMYKFKPKSIPYSQEDINFLISEIEKEEMWIELFLKDKKFMKITYETDVCECPEQTVTSVLNFLDITTKDLPALKSSQKIMSTSLNKDFIERYKKDVSYKF